MTNFKFKDASLPVDERVTAILKELTLDEKLSMLTTFQPPVERLGLKAFWVGAEVARGLVGREYPTTVFPEPFGLAATFDTDVMKKMGEITGIESRICNKQGKTSLCVWGPTVDAERDPRWGRTEEAYGEDPFLIGEMSAAYTKGMAGDDENNLRVIPMLKHFYANNNEENRTNDNASVPLELKHNYYLKAFETAFRKGGAKGVMAAYNEINGVEALCNPELGEILKKDWGMLFSVTDGGDFMQNVLSHHSDSTFTETAARVYKTHGADLMTDNGSVVRKAVSDAISKGLLSESDLDSALFGVFKARFLLGEIDGNSPYDNYDEKLLCCDDFYKASEKAAIESVILLQNDNKILPLTPAKKTLVAGVHADMVFRDWYTGISEKNETILDGIKKRIGTENVLYDSGNDTIAIKDKKSELYFSVEDDGSVLPSKTSVDESCVFELFEWGDNKISLRSKKTGKFLTGDGKQTCTAQEVFGWFVREMITMEKHADGIALRNWQNRYIELDKKGYLAVSKSHRPENYVFEIEVVSSGSERLQELAKGAEQVVLFGGNHPLINAREMYDRKHLELPEKISKTLSALLDVNENTVLFLVSGYPYAIHEKRLSATMHISHAGPALGVAVSKTLFGDVAPSGHCPMTWYSSGSELSDIKDYNIIGTKSTYLYYTGKPLFPFGHGLSYVDFVYSGLSVEKSKEKIALEFQIKNSGDMDATEIPQAYISAPRFSSAIPLKQLKAFKRVEIKKGGTEKIALEINMNDISFWDINTKKQEVYSGNYKIMIGRSSMDIRLETEVTIDGTEYNGIDVSNVIPASASYDYMGVTFKTNKTLEEYALLGDWQSFLNYHNCSLKNYNRVEVTVAMPGDKANLDLIISGLDEAAASCEIQATDGTEDVATSFEIQATGGTDNFVKVTAEIKPVEGMRTLTFKTGGSVAIKCFRFFKE